MVHFSFQVSAGASSNTTLLFPGISLSYAQAAILLCLGLQHKTVDKVVEELTLQPNQVLALFIKIIKKVSFIFLSFLHHCCVACSRTCSHELFRL